MPLLGLPMGLRDLIYRLDGDPPSEERLLSSLERIALALEVISGLSRPEDPLPGDTSEALYTDDLAEFEKDIRREAYTSRTGRSLGEGEEPPSHGTDAFEV